MESGWNQEALTVAFNRALSDEIKDELAARDPATDLEPLIDMVIQLDNRLRERRRERTETSRKAPIQHSLALPLSPDLICNMHWGTHAAGSVTALPIWVRPQDEREMLPVLWLIWPLSSFLPNSLGKSQLPSREGRTVTREATSPHSACSGALLNTYILWNYQSHALKAFIDSVAAGNFIDLEVARHLRVPLTNLDDPLTITALDGRPLGSGQVSKRTIPLYLQVGSHLETIQFRQSSHQNSL